MHTGTLIHCPGCGLEHKRPMVSIDALNEERRLKEAALAKVTPDDVLVLRDVDPEQALDVAQDLKRAKGCSLVLILCGDATVEMLDEEQMRQHGWVRA